MTRYAILGWGSLIWDLEILTPQTDGAWRMRAGPRLPMEFTRVSPKRKMGLVVCLDAAHGVECATHAIGSVRSGIAEVRADLAARERAALDLIGAVCRRTGLAHGRSGAVVAAVTRWCDETGHDGAVWTDLPSNFDDHLGEGFSIARAESYLLGLTGESLDEAVRYIRNAPPETDTPLRRHLAADPWWRGLRSR